VAIANRIPIRIVDQYTWISGNQATIPSIHIFLIGAAAMAAFAGFPAARYAGGVRGATPGAFNQTRDDSP
jgi:hypothetical protein